MVEGGEFGTVLETPKEATLCLVEDAGERTCACFTAIVHIGGCERDGRLLGRLVGRLLDIGGVGGVKDYCSILKQN